MTVAEVADAVVTMLIQACFIICPFSHSWHCQNVFELVLTMAHILVLNIESLLILRPVSAFQQLSKNIN